VYFSIVFAANSTYGQVLELASI